MKNIYKIFLLSFLVFAVSCENEDDSRFTDNPESGWIEFQSASTTVAVTPRTTSINVTVDFTAPINLSAVTVGYTVNNVSGLPADVVTGLGSSVTIAGNTNRSSIVMIPLSDAVQSLISGGDVVFEIELTSATRGISVGLADGSATTVHTVNLLCGGEPLAGAYTVDMTDAFNDGWQTDDPNGGSGISITLTNVDGSVTEVEVGLCSPYTSAAGTFLGSGDCTDGGGAGTAIVNIPAGTVDAVWNFPGDYWDEIGFDIYNPAGTLLYSASPGEEAGELPISYCI